MEAIGDLRELTFQQVVDQVLKANGVKVGGFPEELFVDLTEEQKESWICNICFLIANDPCECTNRHLFCRTCIFAWSLTHGENSQKCPMCRCDMDKYLHNKDLQKQMDDKRVSCQEKDCTFKAPLKIFLMHSHGKKLYNNGNVDLESLRPARREMPRVLIVPTGALGRQRGLVFHSQIEQGRQMIHNMMLLLHLEMNLRQQALTSYTQAHDPVTRLARLDEVLALNEQLNEVGGILSNLLHSPINQALTGEGGRNQGPSREDPDTEPAIPSTSALTSTISPPHFGDTDDSDDDGSESDGSDISSIRRRLSAMRRTRDAHDAARRGPVMASTSAVTSGATSTALAATATASSIGPNVRARRASEIRAGLSVMDSTSLTPRNAMAATTGSSSQQQTLRATDRSADRSTDRSTDRPLLSRTREPQPVIQPQSRTRPAGVSTLQRLSDDSPTSDRSEINLPTIASASPRPDPASPQPSTSADARNPVIPEGSNALQRTLQSMGEGRLSRSRAGRGNLVPRTNGAFAASILNGSGSSGSTAPTQPRQPAPAQTPAPTDTQPRSNTPVAVPNSIARSRPQSSIRTQTTPNPPEEVPRRRSLSRSMSRSVRHSLPEPSQGDASTAPRRPSNGAQNTNATGNVSNVSRTRNSSLSRNTNNSLSQSRSSTTVPSRTNPNPSTTTPRLNTTAPNNVTGASRSSSNVPRSLQTQRSNPGQTTLRRQQQAQGRLSQAPRQSTEPRAPLHRPRRRSEIHEDIMARQRDS